MAKKGKSTKIALVGTPVVGEPTKKATLPDFTNVIKSDVLTEREKRNEILVQLGLKQKKRKYPTPEARKAAAKERSAKRRKERSTVLAQYGLEPKKRGPKRSEDEKAEARRERGKTKRAFIREMARAEPDLAKKYGIDPSRFKL